MKLAFLPGELFLELDCDGNYVVRLKGETVLATRIKNKAVGKYNAIREVLEKTFPPSVPNPDEMRAVLLKEIGAGELQGLKASNIAGRKTRQRSRTFG